MTDQRHVYQVVEVIRVVDGDTYWLRLDTGFRQQTLVNVRLAGYDCPEKNRGTTFERAAAKRAQWLAQGFFESSFDRGITVRTEPDPDDFGRWLGHVTDADGHLLGEALLEAGLATLWPQRWHEKYDPEAG